MAVGQLLIELDHDDTLTPDALELLKDALIANPDAGFFYTEAIELYEGTEKTVDYGADWAFGQVGVEDGWFDFGWFVMARVDSATSCGGKVKARTRR